MTVIAALTRGDIANYVQALFLVYILLIFLYILLNMMFQFGLRPSYSRWLDVLLDFLRDCSEPFLRLFRRFLPMLGGLDLSPMVAIIVLLVLRGIITNAIA
jgi:YggT family protein